MNKKQVRLISIIFFGILFVGVFIIIISSFYNSYYQLYGRRMDKIFAEADQYKQENNTTGSDPVSKRNIEDSFFNSQINPMDLSYNYPKATPISIKNESYEYVDKTYKINDNLELKFKVPKNAEQVDEKNYNVKDLFLRIKIESEKIEKNEVFEEYDKLPYKLFVPEYIADHYQNIKDSNVLRKSLNQLNVFDYYYYEVFTLQDYSTYFLIVQNGYVISINTRTSIEDYTGDYQTLVDYITHLYLTSYVNVIN